MPIVRQRPFADMINMQEELGKFFDEFFGERMPARRGPENPTWIPRVDISESKGDIIVRADAPGMNKDEIKITISDNVLTVAGEKKVERDEKTENFHRVERVFGSFQRSFHIPQNINAEKISASYKDGVLVVTLPKREEAKPKEIPVKVE